MLMGMSVTKYSMEKNVNEDTVVAAVGSGSLGTEEAFGITLVNSS